MRGIRRLVQVVLVPFDVAIIVGQIYLGSLCRAQQREGEDEGSRARLDSKQHFYW